MKFKIDDKVQMTKDALTNYGQKYKNKVLTITRAAHSYMPPNEFYSTGMPARYHPGYDNSLKGEGLYDFKGLNFSLYGYELKSA